MDMTQTFLDKAAVTKSSLEEFSKIVPTSHKMLRKMFLDGKESVFSKLLSGAPISRVGDNIYQDKGDFAVLSPITYLSIALSSGVPLYYVDGCPNPHIYNTECLAMCEGILKTLLKECCKHDNNVEEAEKELTLSVYSKIVCLLMTEPPIHKSTDAQCKYIDTFMAESEQLVTETNSLSPKPQAILMQMREYLVVGKQTACHEAWATRKLAYDMSEHGKFLVVLWQIWIDDVECLNTITNMKQMKLMYGLLAAPPGHENDGRHQVSGEIFFSHYFFNKFSTFFNIFHCTSKCDILHYFFNKFSTFFTIWKTKYQKCLFCLTSFYFILY